jgi:hypothetical protein
MGGLFDELGVVNMIIVIFPFVGISMYVSLNDNMGLPIIILCACVGIGLLIMIAAGKNIKDGDADDTVADLKRQINVQHIVMLGLILCAFLIPFFGCVV